MLNSVEFQILYYAVAYHAWPFSFVGPILSGEGGTVMTLKYTTVKLEACKKALFEIRITELCREIHIHHTHKQSQQCKAQINHLPSEVSGRGDAEEFTSTLYILRFNTCLL